MKGSFAFIPSCAVPQLQDFNSTGGCYSPETPKFESNVHKVENASPAPSPPRMFTTSGRHSVVNSRHLRSNRWCLMRTSYVDGATYGLSVVTVFGSLGDQVQKSLDGLKEAVLTQFGKLAQESPDTADLDPTKARDAIPAALGGAIHDAAVAVEHVVEEQVGKLAQESPDTADLDPSYSKDAIPEAIGEVLVAVEHVVEDQVVKLAQESPDTADLDPTKPEDKIPAALGENLYDVTVEDTKP